MPETTDLGFTVSTKTAIAALSSLSRARSNTGNIKSPFKEPFSVGSSGVLPLFAPLNTAGYD